MDNKSSSGYDMFSNKIIKAIKNEISIYDYHDHNNILSEQKYGFRANHSAELAAIKLVDNIVHEIDRKLTPVNIYILIFQKHLIY